MTEKDSFSEIGEIPHTKADTLQDFCFVVAAFNLSLIHISGCNQVLNFLTQTAEPFLFVCCLNDRAQDGKDVSWIWDVDFERLCEMGDTLREIYVSGVRADDMALRFAYAGFPTNRIHVVKDYKALCEQSTSHKLPVYMLSLIHISRACRPSASTAPSRTTARSASATATSARCC